MKNFAEVFPRSITVSYFKQDWLSYTLYHVHVIYESEPIGTKLGTVYSKWIYEYYSNGIKHFLKLLVFVKVLYVFF